MKCGDAFLFPLDDSHSEHLWIVLTNPNADGEILIVSITTVYAHDKDKADMTMLLHKGEHRFITRDSYIYYREAMIKKASDLEAEEKTGTLKMHDSCTPEVLSLVRGGISASKHCAKVIRGFYSDHKHL